jgi:hypothetical protein
MGKCGIELKILESEERFPASKSVNPKHHLYLYHFVLYLKLTNEME